MTSPRALLITLAAGLIVVASLVPRPAHTQSLARRIAAAGDGKVRFTFAAKPGICGHGTSISRGGDVRMNWGNNESSDVDYDLECDRGPVRIVLEVRDGAVTKLRTFVGGRWRPASTSTSDLGTIPVREAVDYLLGLTRTHNGAPARDAILPVTLADSVQVWRPLIQVARDETRPSSTRKQALFWVGQEAADRVTDEIVAVARDNGVDREVKKSAVFALSQRRNGEAVPALIRVARENRDPEVKKAALFWLGQTGDPRAIALFEEILAR